MSAKSPLDVCFQTILGVLYYQWKSDCTPLKAVFSFLSALVITNCALEESELL